MLSRASPVLSIARFFCFLKCPLFPLQLIRSPGLPTPSPPRVAIGRGPGPPGSGAFV